MAVNSHSSLWHECMHACIHHSNLSTWASSKRFPSRANEGGSGSGCARACSARKRREAASRFFFYRYQAPRRLTKWLIPNVSRVTELFFFFFWPEFDCALSVRCHNAPFAIRTTSLEFDGDSTKRWTTMWRSPFRGAVCKVRHKNRSTRVKDISNGSDFQYFPEPRRRRRAATSGSSQKFLRDVLRPHSR